MPPALPDSTHAERDTRQQTNGVSLISNLAPTHMESFISIKVLMVQTFVASYLCTIEVIPPKHNFIQSYVSKIVPSQTPATKVPKVQFSVF
jgi:hypothetical protein